MNVIILGGFLGSGKTTSLLQFARYLVSVSSPERENKVAILENEVGEVGIDDKVLATSGFAVSNLFAGCACCTVSGEFTDAARRIRDELNPEWLIIETTGIAYPASMRENLDKMLSLSARIVVIADAKRWMRLRAAMGELVAAQVEGSDAVLINKCDLADEETLAEIERDLRGIEPTTAILRVSAKSEIATEVWRTASGIS